MSKAILFTACIALLSCSASAAQVSTDAKVLALTRVEHFQIVDGTFLDGVEKLIRTVPANFGIEEILKLKYSDPQINNPRFSLDLENVTLGSILDAMSEHDHRYTWSIDGATINIYPCSTVAKDSYLMNRHLKLATLNDVSNPDRALFALDQQLPPPREQFGYVETGGDNTYGTPWTASFADLTVREFVNRIAEHMGPSTVWIFRGSQEERLFTFQRVASGGGAARK